MARGTFTIWRVKQRDRGARRSLKISGHARTCLKNIHKRKQPPMNADQRRQAVNRPVSCACPASAFISGQPRLRLTWVLETLQGTFHGREARLPRMNAVEEPC